jgi:ketosteroid isomerase-like protein
MTLEVHAADADALDVAQRAFLGLRRGAGTGDWDDFVDLLADDVRIMIPVPAGVENPPEGLLVGKDIARQLFGSHHEEKVQGAALECKRVAANGGLVVLECRVEGNLNGENVANHFVFVFEVEGGLIASMYEYASWTAKNETSGWGDPAFAREAFGPSLIPKPGAAA